MSDFFSSPIAGDIVGLSVIICAHFFLTLASAPFASFLFGNWKDQGIAFSGIVGWLIVAYVWFLGTTIGILTLERKFLFLLCFVWLIFNFWIYLHTKKFKFDKEYCKKFAWNLIGFSALLFFWYWVKGHSPELYQIERFMDFGILRVLENSRTLPIETMWFVQDKLNYYYFGHFIGHTLLTFTGIPLERGFFILVIWLYASIGLGIISCAKEIASAIFRSSLLANISAFISWFECMFAGTFHIIYWMGLSLRGVLANLAGNSTGIASDFLMRMTSILPSKAYWYADATRFISGTITEMPIYAFLVAEIHAHVFGFLFGILALAVCIAIWKEGKERFTLLSPIILIIPLILGGAYMANSWDALTLGVLIVTCLIVKYREDFLKHPSRFLLNLICIPLLSYLVALPWSYYFIVPVSGQQGFIGLVQHVSNPYQWFLYWGGFMILLLPYVIFVLKKNGIKLFTATNQDNHWHLFNLTIIGLGLFFLLLVEVVYFRDILKDGEWYRANTVFKISNQVWVWFAVISGASLIYLLLGIKRKVVVITVFIFVLSTLLMQGLYGYKIINQVIGAREFTGVSTGLDWFRDKYPDDYAAYIYLDTLRQQDIKHDVLPRIVEAEGDSFQDYNFFSTFLGWPTLLGWYGHEWTWRGTNKDLETRKAIVRNIYTDQNETQTKEKLHEFSVKYLILGTIERERYGEINESKLLRMGKVIFEQNKVKIIEVD